MGCAGCISDAKAPSRSTLRGEFAEDGGERAGDGILEARVGLGRLPQLGRHWVGWRGRPEPGKVVPGCLGKKEGFVEVRLMCVWEARGRGEVGGAGA